MAVGSDATEESRQRTDPTGQSLDSSIGGLDGQAAAKKGRYGTRARGTSREVLELSNVRVTDGKWQPQQRLTRELAAPDASQEEAAGGGGLPVSDGEEGEADSKANGPADHDAEPANGAKPAE
ncbi:hypothetical protein PR002_g5153 [Phytophthora rubi]|uniref:Uncharacterized protein n=1 Tax=Phytophthora rubi TaxID=129364 RepID=A0A6A3N8Z9_9STRA|nr:hypothetical protein PR002_g5153 [Phytophthora rubi]